MNTTAPKRQDQEVSSFNGPAARWSATARFACPTAEAIDTSPATGISNQARHEMGRLRGEPFWLCQWRDVVFIHFECDPAVLQAETRFELDLHDGRAFVSLVAFTLKDMRPRIGGRIAWLVLKPFGSHRFLNVRTYVKHANASGIYFLCEFLDAPWLNHLAGPLLYGLPFRVARLRYEASAETRVHGVVEVAGGRLEYTGKAAANSECPKRSIFLLERYRAFTERKGRRGWFPVWHEPWSCTQMELDLVAATLLETTGCWFKTSRPAGAHFSSGLAEVWMGLRRGLKLLDTRSQTSV